MRQTLREQGMPLDCWLKKIEKHGYLLISNETLSGINRVRFDCFIERNKLEMKRVDWELHIVKPIKLVA